MLKMENGPNVNKVEVVTLSSAGKPAIFSPRFTSLRAPKTIVIG